MNFNEKLIELRKAKGLSQDELGQRIGVSRQTVSKWELAQSYPDFQRLVLLSDYFGLSLDALVKDIDLQDVRDKTAAERQITAIYDDVQRSKSILSSINALINGLAIFGIVGVAILLLLILFLH
ncbi:MAG: helix-turn-helix transcriptional regulator [Firmicutes bacterium]|nr:helix-turn-helix transcriptional regulator [Bacillota bacterium]